MKEKLVCEECCEMISIKKVYLEQSVKEYINKNSKKKFDLQKGMSLADTPLRADVIITMNVEQSKARLEEIVDIYEFLIEEDEVKSWRAELPIEREFIDLKKIAFCD